MTFALGYLTFPSVDDAERIVGRLLEERVIACANFFPIESRYRWRGEIERAREFVAIVKTIPERWDEVCAAVAREHPYDVPCIVRLDAEAAPSFGAWMREETEPGAARS